MVIMQEHAMVNIFDDMTLDLEQELSTIDEYRPLEYRKVAPIEYIRSRKNQLKITNKQLAVKVEVSESLISKILKGQRMTRDNLIKICITLEMNINEINQLMRYFNYPTLYVKDKRDQIILHGIQNDYSINAINKNLKRNKIKQLL